MGPICSDVPAEILLRPGIVFSYPNSYKTKDFGPDVHIYLQVKDSDCVDLSIRKSEEVTFGYASQKGENSKKLENWPEENLKKNKFEDLWNLLSRLTRIL